MGSSKNWTAVLLLVSVLVWILNLHWWGGEEGVTRIFGDDVEPGRYDTRGGPVPHKLNVHLVPHTHDDVGWLKTVDQYYVGSNNSIRVAAVQYILDSVISSLQEDPNRKFIYVEQAFFQRWWREQTKSKQELVKKLVESGQLEFINGGWCMHDEASPHYIDMIDQTTRGHRFIKSQFNKVPRIGWQIDPFGHSAVQAYLLGAEVGFDALFFGRADYQDVAKRRANRAMEFVWRGSKSLQSSAQIFGGVLSHHYSPPDGMNFDIQSNDTVIQDDPFLYDYNLWERIELFVKHAQDQGKEFQSNHIMWTMGGDFTYENANTWFKQMDKIVHYMNKDGRINVFYSTPSVYVDLKNAANITWPLKTEDFFPYADCPHCYWTGYFSSRSALKGYVRRLSAYLMAVRQLEFLVRKDGSKENTDALEDALAISQHHDAVSGTEKQHVANDYAKRLASGAAEAAHVMEAAVASLVSGEADVTSQVTELNQWMKRLWKLLCSSKYFSIMEERLCSSHRRTGFTSLSFHQCPLLNISHCPPSEASLRLPETLLVVAYNSLAWNRKEIVRIPVSSDLLQVKDSQGKIVPSQIIPLNSMSRKVRETYVVAYTGSSPSNESIYTLVFKASVPPLGFSTYYISKSNSSYGATLSSVREYKPADVVKVNSGNISLSFSTSTGHLERLTNYRTGASLHLKQSYCWYNSSDGKADDQASGAYVFRPNTSTCYPINPDKLVTTVVQGPLVQEVHQQISSWLFQVIRLYKDAEHVEIEYTVGPIPVDSTEAGKEVVMRLSTDLASAREFYTDSNGRDFLKRVRNYRTDWDLNVTEPIAGNYYPLNLGIYIRGNRTDLSVLVDRAIGGSSLSDGEVELMLHRRLLYDDDRGVHEALNEVVCVDDNACEGLTVRGVVLVNVDPGESATRWRRTEGQKLYSPLELLFSTIPNSNIDQVKRSTFSATMPGYELPPNIAIITLQELENKDVLLRLAHIYEIEEDKDLSKTVVVDLQNIFGLRKIEKVVELGLSANQERAAMQPLKWQVDAQNSNQPAQNSNQPVRGALFKDGDGHIEIAPMEIKTLQITFAS